LAPYTDLTMICYAITSPALYPGSEQEKPAALLAEASRWVAEGINFIQLRQKDLPAFQQAALAHKILEAIRLASSTTKLLINSRPDIALAMGAHGVHLTSSPDELTPTQVRTLYAVADHEPPLITISCHTLAEVQFACQNKVDAVLFSPVFEKPLPDAPPIHGQGLDQLKAACSLASPTPVYALGGVTLQNASSCLAVGAAGIAGIRLFQSAVTAK
jgi:thiamine-phosphate pyrophosphorylase